MRFRPPPAFVRIVHSLALQLVLLYIPLAALLFWADRRCTIAVNLTESLPQKLFVIHKGPFNPQLGMLAAFPLPKRIADAHGYREGSVWVKRIAGLPGERITVNGRKVFVGGRPAGKAMKSGTLSGPLEPAAEGVIPAGQVFLAGESGNSLDSRYRSFGLIPLRTLQRVEAVGSDHVMDGTWRAGTGQELSP